MVNLYISFDIELWILFNFSDEDSSKLIWLEGPIVFHCIQFKLKICLAHSQIKRHENVFFRIFILKKKEFQHHIHKKIFNIFSLIWIPFFSIEFEFNSIQANLNQSCWFYFNWIGIQFQFKFHSM
jgi:hypothetical protein